MAMGDSIWFGSSVTSNVIIRPDRPSYDMPLFSIDLLLPTPSDLATADRPDVPDSIEPDEIDSLDTITGTPLSDITKRPQVVFACGQGCEDVFCSAGALLRHCESKHNMNGPVDPIARGYLTEEEQDAQYEEYGLEFFKQAKEPFNMRRRRKRASRPEEEREAINKKRRENTTREAKDRKNAAARLNRANMTPGNRAANLKARRDGLTPEAKEAHKRRCREWREKTGYKTPKKGSKKVNES